MSPNFDLVILSANPLEKIEFSDRIEKVMLNGRLYDAATLEEQVTGDRRLRPIFWKSEPQSALLP